MKIKTILVAFSLIAIQMNVFAQKGELNSAKSNYEKFVQLRDAGSLLLAVPSLKTAKTAIDKAVANEKTIADPAAWTYKALIYADLAIQDSTEAAVTTRTVAEAAYQKAVELDTQGLNKTQLQRVNELFAQIELNKGVKAYQAQNFKEAYSAFNNSLNYKPGDTTITYYAGLSAINAQDYPAVIEKYNLLLKTDFSVNNQIALDLSKIYALNKDTVKAIETASMYAAKFNDNALATQEIELSLMSGKEKQILTKISDQAAKDPKNKIFPFYLGIAYSAAKDYKKSEEAYKKALEIDPKFEDAIINLGSTVLNNGIDTYNTANKLPANKQKEYDIMMKQANIEFDRALPYLQKAVEINPKSINGWENLKTYYVIRRNQAKVDEITKILAGL